jgi:hypothetical protein
MPSCCSFVKCISSLINWPSSTTVQINKVIKHLLVWFIPSDPNISGFAHGDDTLSGGLDLIIGTPFVDLSKMRIYQLSAHCSRSI